MGYNYFTKKEEYKQYAIKHTEEMEHKYYREIAYSASGTEVLEGQDIIKYPPIASIHPTVQYWDLDTVGAIFKADPTHNIWVLNFASYKNPGGMFIEGSSAQEESLCRESILYNVLRDERFKQYYINNRKDLNNGMYRNRMLLSPRVLFERWSILDDTVGSPYQQIAYAHVITCAAPNYSNSLRYGRFSKEENDNALLNRIRFILMILQSRISEGDTIILGAYGCGVFKQDPKIVAEYFNQNLYMLEKNCLVVYAVPSKFPASIVFKDAAQHYKGDTQLRSALLDKFTNKY